MGKKTPQSKLWPLWTEARVRSFIRSALRAAYAKWPPRFEALKQARRAYKGTDKRRKYEYQCACCKGWFKGTEVQVDHIEGAGSTLEGWDSFIERLFCGVEGLQILCKSCHNTKTQEEKKDE